MRRALLTVIAACAVGFLLPMHPVDAGPKEANVVEMKVKGVAVHPETNSPVVMLESVGDKRELPIWIGFPEAQAIALQLENITTPRPMTHDLLKDILDKLNIRVVKIVISDLKNDIFFATITLERENKTMEVDSRPSDALALAVKVRAPIYAANFVLEQARATEGFLREAGEGIHKRYGLRAQTLNQELADYFGLPNKEGVLVSTVQEQGVAGKAGLKRGDVITRVDGIQTLNLKDFYDTLAKLENKKEFPVNVIRDNGKITLTFRVP